jgi:hypothetical protein
MANLRALRALRVAFENLAPRASVLTEAESTLLRDRMCEAADVMRCARLGSDRTANALRDMAHSAATEWRDNRSLEALIRGCLDEQSDDRCGFATSRND